MDEPADPGENALRQVTAHITADQTGSLEAFEALYAALAPPVLAYLASLCRDRERARNLLSGDIPAAPQVAGSRLRASGKIFEYVFEVLPEP